MIKITIDPKYTKTYKTEANLDKALAALNLPDSLMYLLVQVDGRFTAVFTNTRIVESGAYMPFLAHKGFKVVG